MSSLLSLNSLDSMVHHENRSQIFNLHFSSLAFLSLYSTDKTLILNLQQNGVGGEWRKTQNRTDWSPFKFDIIILK